MQKSALKLNLKTAPSIDLGLNISLKRRYYLSCRDTHSTLQQCSMDYQRIGWGSVRGG